MLLLIHLMMLYRLQQIGFYSYKMQEQELKAATGIEVTHLDIYAFFKKERASLLSDSSKITYPAGLDPPQKMYYQLSV